MGSREVVVHPGRIYSSTWVVYQASVCEVTLQVRVVGIEQSGSADLGQGEYVGVVRRVAALRLDALGSRFQLALVHDCHVSGLNGLARPQPEVGRAALKLLKRLAAGDEASLSRRYPLEEAVTCPRRIGAEHLVGDIGIDDRAHVSVRGGRAIRPERPRRFF